MMVRALLVSCLLFSISHAATIEPKGRDAAALVAAIAKAEPRDLVQLGEGTYELTAPLALKSRIILLGAGQDKTKLIYRGEKAGPMISLVDCEYVQVAALTLDGQRNPLVHQGISASNSKHLWLHNLTIRDLVKSDTFGPHGILFSGRNPTMERGVTDSRIDHCHIENIGVGAKFGGGIRMNWGSVRNKVTDNVIKTTGRGGIFGDHSTDLTICRNRVEGSEGEGLGIEIWGGCHRSLIEDNVIDHWLSNDGGSQTAIRRNTIGTDDGTLKGYGIEIIARDNVVTDNVVKRGQHIGLSVSNKPVKDNVYWANNTVSDCLQWGAQLQGEAGGIARHYFYRCTFENTVGGDKRARYPNDAGHGFRTNGDCRQLVFDACTFQGNGGLGVQLGGKNIDAISFLGCTIVRNGLLAVRPPADAAALEFIDCKVKDNGNDKLPTGKPLPGLPPVAAFTVPDPNNIRDGQTVSFACTSTAGEGEIVERLWDFGDGLPETVAKPQHTFTRPGHHYVTLIIWNTAGRAARAEKLLDIGPGHTMPARPQ